MRRVTVFSCLTLIALSFLFLASACGGEENPFGVRSELVTEADRPFAMAFAPDGRLFYGEQFTGNIRVVTADGELLAEPFARVDVAVFFRWGLSGLALDPDFEANHYVYAFFTEPAGSEGGAPIGRPVLVRFRDQNNRGTDRETILGDLSETPPEHPGVNANGGIHFGPDGLLYLTIGDYETFREIGPGGKPFAQDLSTPVGKMLRVNKESGEAPPDNPFVDQPDADPRIFALGFLRNFDFVFHPETGQIYGTDGTASCEELNIITAGGNYGYPDIGDFPFPDCFAGEQIRAIHLLAVEGKTPGEFLSTPVVSGLEFVSGQVYSKMGDSLVFCESETQVMRRLVLTGPNFDRVADDVIPEDDVIVEDCQMDIAVSPDGIIYYSNETEIRRLVPIEPEPEES